MAIDYDKIMNWPFQPVEQTYTEKDSILYALGLGLGADPLDEHQLRFTFEEADGVDGYRSPATAMDRHSPEPLDCRGSVDT